MVEEKSDGSCCSSQDSPKPLPVASLCQECAQHPSKYKCPACGIQSCCLHCVNTHKLRTSCSGKRDRSSFVPLAAFDDTRLISDYNFLEEVLRQADSAKRLITPFELTKQELSGRWSILRSQTKKRNMTLLYLPQGMTRRMKNNSRYCRKRKCILWRIEWIFHPTDLRLVDTSADENLSPAKMLENKLVDSNCNPAARRKLLEGPVDCMRFLLVKEPCSGEQKSFVELDPSESLGSQLSGLTIIEYPVIHVVSPTCMTKFTIVKNLRSNMAEAAVAETALDVDMSEREGIPYREEEIEEGEIVD